jgi:hypothetical protein
MSMRTFFVLAFVLLFDLNASAATLQVEVNRQGFIGPLEVAIAPRVDGKAPEWSSTKTLNARQTMVSFDGLTEGLYVVLASGAQPLQRLSAKANIGTNGSTIRLVIPKSKTIVRATLAGEPLAHAAIALSHDELHWHTELETGDDGRFAGDLWEPAVYTASVSRDPLSAPHRVDVFVSPSMTIINVPDRHVRGRVLDKDGKPLAGAIVTLRSETSQLTLSLRAHSAPDGWFEFFGVREGAQTLTARAPSYVDSDAARFELHGASAQKTTDLVLTRGEPRAVRVVDARDHPIANATLITSCNGDVKSTAVTNDDGTASVAVPSAASCAIYVLPKEGSIAVGRFAGAERLVIRVPEGTSSLQLALKTDTGETFSDLRLLMRIDGMVVPPEIARLLSTRGFSLMTNAEGSISLKHIPPGTYEFWPYRTTAEGQMIYDIATEFPAPISVRVLSGENNATIRFQAR